MPKLLIDLDAETLSRLEGLAPARTRKRSEFIRMAIRRAIWEIEERRVAEAYARTPDSSRDAYLDPRAWETPAPRRGARRARSRRR
jgi:predicted transcriptional regulator